MKRYRILSIDGGGVKGLLPAIWLQHIESQLPDPLHTYFDSIAGCSSGAITACAIASGYSAKQVVDIYKSDVQMAFPSRWLRRIINPLGSLYPAGGVEKLLDKHFGDKLFGELLVQTMVVSYNMSKGNAAIFLSNEDRNHKIKDICRVSSAAPIYFPPAKLSIGGEEQAFIDGAIVSNNPIDIATVCYTENHQVNQGLFLLSMGTGSPYYDLDADEVCAWNAYNWLGNLTRVIFDGTSDGSEFAIKHKVSPEAYARWQVPLMNASMSIDDCSTSNIKALEAEAYKLINSDIGKDLTAKTITRLLEDNTE